MQPAATSDMFTLSVRTSKGVTQFEISLPIPWGQFSGLGSALAEVLGLSIIFEALMQREAFAVLVVKTIPDICHKIRDQSS